MVIKADQFEPGTSSMSHTVRPIGARQHNQWVGLRELGSCEGRLDYQYEEKRKAILLSL